MEKTKELQKEIELALEMSKREYIAVMAMQSLCVNIAWSGTDRELNILANRAVKAADALLEQLAKDD